ncbi:MAG TPA: PEGA domain-containing protein, partial [Sedimentisphaerales bacterium]|nr:PEGA domain-containing protein [Sedimentisphaerales bacterium]
MMHRIMVLLPAAILLVGGCGGVQREITIRTQPAGAVVVLNDEEIGTSPVTVAFNWYGDYNVRISLEGYRTLITNRELDAPWYDYFPFDLLRAILPGRTTDRYEWFFELEEMVHPTREELIRSAMELMRDSET